MTVVRVRASVEIDVEFDDEVDNDLIHFMVEENSCPGTGIVGGALRALVHQHDEASTCWACGNNGENKILSIRRGV